METTQADLLQDFTVVARSFEQLSQRLTDVAEQVRTTGALPSESLIEDIATSRRSFADLRAKALELVDLLAGLPPVNAEEIESMQELEALLHLITDAQRKKAQAERARGRAITVLDRILSLVHRDQPEFPPLIECQAKARAMRDAIHQHAGPEAHSDVVALAQGRHPLSELLTLVEGANDLDDDLWLLLKQATADHFGKSLALSAARGKLNLSAVRFVAGHKGDDPVNEQPAQPTVASGANGNPS